MAMIADTRIDNHHSTLYKTAHSHYSKEQIRHLKEQATTQEKIIARWYWNNPDSHIGPGRLHTAQGYTWPLTSTRRAITNLTEAGILEKTAFQSMGSHGRPEHHWKWKTPALLKYEQRSLF